MEKCVRCNETGKIMLNTWNKKREIDCQVCNGHGAFDLEFFIKDRGVLTGSRGMGFETYDSDWDYAITNNDYDIVSNQLGLKQHRDGSGGENLMMNDSSTKFYYNDKLYNLISYPTSDCLDIIRNITKAVSIFQQAEEKEIRNQIFEFLCQLLITPKVKGIPEIELDPDEIPF